VRTFEPEYKRLVDNLHENIDWVSSVQNFDPEISKDLRGVLKSVRARERSLCDGLALILNNTADTETLYWFAKIVRSEILSTLWTYQLADRENVVSFGSQWKNVGLVSADKAANLFDIPEASEIVFTRDEGGKSGYFKLWMDKKVEDELIREPDGTYLHPAHASDLSLRDLGKFVYPQMVDAFVRFSDDKPAPFWCLDGIYMGID
ncbi:MAG: hypothetical protein AAF681_14100, partial [Pseudomonadota bacterium]